MDYSQPWVYPHEAICNPTSSASVSSYFSRPNKVVKSSSRNSSPRTLARRKTTTAATISSRTRSAVDHLRSSAQYWQNPEVSRSRPVSWHPNSANALNIPFNPSINCQDLSAWTFSTAEVNGLITPISFPTANEPQIQELITPLDELPGHDMNFPYDAQQYDAQLWNSQTQSKADQYDFNMIYQTGAVQPTWQLNQHALPMDVQTAPSSPDCLPVQIIGLDTLCLDTTNSGTKEDQEELVGMGLYDSPAEVQSSSLLFGTSSNIGRRALKLEESFEPAEQDEEEDEDGEPEEMEEEEGSDDASEQVDVDEDCAAVKTFDSNHRSEPLVNHAALETRQETESLASKYLATLGQLNSAYYPAGHGYNWI